MADYYLEYSFTLPVTKTQLNWLKPRLKNSSEWTEKQSQKFTEEGWWADDWYGHGYEVEKIGNDTELWFSSELGSDLEALVELLRLFSVKFNCTPIRIEFANTCSRPLPDGFGGGAAVVYRGESYWMNSSTWSFGKIQELTGANT